MSLEAGEPRGLIIRRSIRSKGLLDAIGTSYIRAGARPCRPPVCLSG
jgi:hypothetical protein